MKKVIIEELMQMRLRVDSKGRILLPEEIRNWER